MNAESQFCRYCGAGIGEHFRAGEGTCEKCDPPDPVTGKTRGFQGVSTCTCNTKTPAPSHHREDCHYRQWWARMVEPQAPQNELVSRGGRVKVKERE